MRKVMVTGGAGFIGSHLVEALVAKGIQVRVLDNLSTGKEENLQSVIQDIEFVRGDLVDGGLTARCVQDTDVVFHLGALPSVPRSVADPLKTHQANVSGTLNVLVASKDAGVKRVVLASSSSVYGSGHPLPLREDMLLGPLSPYAASKVSCECYASAFWHAYGLSTLTLRFFNVFGPRQDPGSPYSAVIPKFMKSALKGEEVLVYGDGTQSRDFTYVANVVDACIRAGDCPEGRGDAMNVACGERRSILDLIGAIEEVSGRSIPRRHEPPRKGEVPHSEADISKAQSFLQYQPTVSFREGLAQVWGWMSASLTS